MSTRPGRRRTSGRGPSRCEAAGTAMTSPPAPEPPAAGPPAAGPPAAEPEDPPLRVSTLELFFDLVFVFTITQLTTLLARDQVTPTGALKVVLVFGVLWWIYGGYAWLTNTRAPSRT